MEHESKYEPKREIDPEEGREEKLRSVEPLKCGSCFEEVAELMPCPWDPRLEVGECCFIHNDEKLCPLLSGLLDECLSVREITVMSRVHERCCSLCNPDLLRPRAVPERKAA